MPIGRVSAAASSWTLRFAAPVQALTKTLVRPKRHSRHGATVRAALKRWLVVAALVLAVIAISMVWFDVPAIKSLPPRGTPALWPVRLFTELGEAALFLWPLGIALIAIAIAQWRLRSAAARAVLASVAVRLSYLFLAIGLSALIGTALKSLIGRARPFVGGEPNAFYFMPFAGDPKFESFPSGHAVAAFAAAFAISALWPKIRHVMWTYAVLIAVSRVVLLSHHPSDVIGGAGVGLLGAMLVREWFAVRHLGFFIKPNGTVESLPGPNLGRVKRVARNALAP